MHYLLYSSLIVSLISASAAVAVQNNTGITKSYSPHVNTQYPTQVYWGDTHLHSSYSFDASTMGNRLPPEEAYRFARGEQVVATTGMAAKLNVPLDFLVIADHAFNIGVADELVRMENSESSAGKPAERVETTEAILERLREGGGPADSIALVERSHPELTTETFRQDVWKKLTGIADSYNNPGLFTALIGYEWTSMPGGSNLHRVLVFRDDARTVSQLRPFTAADSDKPEALWEHMSKYEAMTGGRVLAIPHNANVSNGLMFSVMDSEGRPIGASYAATRAHREPLVEVTQIKGDGEAHPFLSPDDEFADFETWDDGNFAAVEEPNKTEDMLQFEYARSALKLGLSLESKVGVNPYKFGMIGSTDSHTSLATAEENNFWGKSSLNEPGKDRTSENSFSMSNAVLRNRNLNTVMTVPWTFSASGYAAVWATDNTREALFDAMERKEVYATTGSRIGVRFFGGWQYQSEDIVSPDIALTGYSKGVPMGGDLPDKTSSAPTFLVMASKDPIGANLDRIQIVKGWNDVNGKPQEKIFNVAVSDNRKVGENQKVRPLKSTVNIENATYTNTIGAAQLAGFWKDPDFDPSLRVFYYARVIEIPTPRWPVYDVVRLGAKLDPAMTQMEIQDRAYTSPIWYTPADE